MTRLLNRLDSTMEATARGLTRRRLMQRAGTGALGVAFGTAYLWQRPDLASGQHTACQGILCSSTRCYDSGYCHCTTRTKRRAYTRGYCLGCDGGTACWTEQHGCLWRCCDCCADYDTLWYTCDFCGGFFWACVCRGIVSC